MSVRARPLLRVALVILLLGSVLAQILVPAYATRVGTTFPAVAHLVAPYSVAAILFIACIEVALLVVWRLLSGVDRGDIFTRDAVRSIEVIAVCAAVATVLSAGVLVHMVRFVPGGGGPMVYYLGVCVGCGLACVLVMLVMRRSLESAVTDRAKLDVTGARPEPPG